MIVPQLTTMQGLKPAAQTPETDVAALSSCAGPAGRAARIGVADRRDGPLPWRMPRRPGSEWSVGP